MSDQLSFQNNYDFSAEYALNFLTKCIHPSYLDSCSLLIQQNSASVPYNSIVISLAATPYRDQKATNFLLARISKSEKNKYIAFSAKSKKYLEQAGLEYSVAASDTSFLRIDLDHFYQYDKVAVGKAVNTVFIDAFSFPSFGCCSKFNKCSIDHVCIHSDPIYATACMYRKLFTVK